MKARSARQGHRVLGHTALRRISSLILVLLLFLLSGCDVLRSIPLPDGLPVGGVTGTPPANHPTSLPATATPGADLGFLSTATAVPSLVLWVPPEFDPAADTHAGRLLQQRLDEFSRQNGGVRVIVRVKASNGAGGLLESLNAAGAAAPLALPSVIALSRSDLETAALKGLIYPLDGVSTAIDQPDWYNYARQIAMVQGATFALPFAGDALIVAYRPAKVVPPPTDWEAVFRLGQPLAFPAGDSQSMFVLSLYQSIGGQVEDAQRRPTLQSDLLSQVLQLMADGEQRGVFPYWLSQYETAGQVWQAYTDGRVNVLVTWLSTYLSMLPPDTAALPLPQLKESPLTLATGWSWAVSDPDPDRRELAIKLCEFLAEGDFLSGWTEAAGYLPTRPSALAAWSNQSLKTLLSPVAVSAQARPTVDQLASLGPVLKEATLKVLKRESDPTQAARAASERLALPEAK
jgi:ABC-type glycerol-3-phosphate transport system substrate-binding protein